MLLVDRFEAGLTLADRRLREFLAVAEFAYNTGFLELLLEFLEGFFDGFAFFYCNYDHEILVFFVLLRAANVCIKTQKQNTALNFLRFFVRRQHFPPKTVFRPNAPNLTRRLLVFTNS